MIWKMAVDVLHLFPQRHTYLTSIAHITPIVSRSSTFLVEVEIYPKTSYQFYNTKVRVAEETSKSVINSKDTYGKP